MKTLKDIVLCDYENCNRGCSGARDAEENLKQAAIEWVNFWNEQIEDHAYELGVCSCDLHHSCLNCDELREKIKWCVLFFNLSEEDLK